MNEIIINHLATELSITPKQVQTVLNLLEEGNTIPFIARYRKEATSALDEEVIREIDKEYQYQLNLMTRKEDVIRLIEEKDMMTSQLKEAILNCHKLIEVEDLYRPYKDKKKTKATEAIAQGLEPLAKMIMSFPEKGSLEQLAAKFLTDQVDTTDKAIAGASYIIAEWISDNANYRKWLRRYIYQNGFLASQKKKNASDEDEIYKIYYDFQESIKLSKPHRILAVNRGEKEGILSVKLVYDKQPILAYFKQKIIKKPSFVTPIVEASIEDSLKRLILPSVEREVRAELKEKAENRAIENFTDNVEHLLLTPPLKEKVVLGFDPAYRTGCKLAVLDKTGKPLAISVIYPNEPRNDIENAKKELLSLIEAYHVDIIAIGNGTASRESETFVAEAIKEAKHPVEYVLVNEAGASVYSASPLAIEEFPDLTVEKRSAISIGRRIQDALSELVKIDPKSIGVGLYQHDVPPKQLDESLHFVVSKVVNQVGVNVNTASPSILQYVSGLTKRAIQAIIEKREQLGKFIDRQQLLDVKGMSPKIYEQSIGFLRIVDGDNPLDRTPIHPESYDKTLQLLAFLQLKVTDLGTPQLIQSLKDLDIESVSKQLAIDHYTLDDMIKALMQPERDPRDQYPQPILRKDILHVEDLKKGDKLQGTVRNVVDFGIFIDIGLKNDGLAHISKLSKSYLRHPSEQFSVGDIVDCYVEEVDVPKKKVSLTLLPLDE